MGGRRSPQSYQIQNSHFSFVISFEWAHSQCLSLVPSQSAPPQIFCHIDWIVMLTGFFGLPTLFFPTTIGATLEEVGAWMGGEDTTIDWRESWDGVIIPGQWTGVVFQEVRRSAIGVVISWKFGWEAGDSIVYVKQNVSGIILIIQIKAKGLTWSWIC